VCVCVCVRVCLRTFIACSLRVCACARAIALHIKILIIIAINLLVSNRPFCLSVCLSVCPSVTLVMHAYAVHGIEIHFARYDRTMSIVTCCQISCSWVYGFTLQNECVKGRHPRSKAKLGPIIHNKLETV